MIFHDNPNRSVNPDFRSVKLTVAVCRERARLFVRLKVRSGEQWDMRDLRTYCTPAGYYLPDEALYSGPATIADLTNFLHSNLRRHG